MKKYAQTLTKFGEKENNEDSYAVHDNKVFVLADGAGGVGMFAREWADTLTQNITHFSTIDALEQQIKDLKIGFYKEREAYLDANPTYFADKFYSEGSAATLLIADCTHAPKVQILSYGDSGIFVYQAQQRKLITNLDINVLSDYPNLINCINARENTEKWYHHELTLQDGDYILLASDAIAQYFRLVYAFEHEEHDFLNHLLSLKNAISAKVDFFQKHRQDIPSFDSLLEKSIAALQTPKTFEEFCQDLHNKNHLEYDDYTLLVIENK